jgi:3-polyprenyl-4-hydroxybenzoate decarboxylase
MADIKHLFVVDGDIDIFSDAQIDWALATRFQADRDLVTSTGYRTVPLDPSLEGEWTGAKAGFDLTLPFGKENSQEFMVPTPPVLKDRRNQTVEAALEDGPKYFRELMEWTGSDDGREIIRVLEGFYADGSLGRLEDGRYMRE